MSNYIINDSVLEPTSTKPWIEAGIQGGLELSHRVQVTENGNVFFEFTLSNASGAKVTRTEWEVKPLRPYNDLTPKLQSTLDRIVESSSNDCTNVQQAAALFEQQRRDAQIARIMEFAKLFVSKDELRGFESTSYLEFCNFISGKIGDSCKGVSLRAKLVYNYRGFVDTPDYVRQGDPWIEREDLVPAEKSQIKINEGKDIVVRPEPRGSRPSGNNPLDSGKPADIKPDSDLPF